MKNKVILQLMQMDEFEQCEMKLTAWTTLYHMNENDEF
jgi:hypothetical protein